MSRNKYPEKTQKLIIEVSTKLFMEKGYENTSLNDIISNLGGLSKGAIYHHFKSKEAIYQAVIYQMTASSDDTIIDIMNKEALTGREKLQMILKYSLEEAIANQKKFKVDYSKNPKMLVELIRELKNEISPLFIKPIIEQGIKDGTIKTDCANELSEFIALSINLWINPIVFECPMDELINKCKLLSTLLSSCNLDILDEEIIKHLCSLV